MGRVTSIASFGRNGLYDWVIQRISAVVITAYFVFLVYFIASNPEMTYEQWRGLFSHFCMQVFSTLALLMLMAHVWIGVWGVLTDYVTPRLMGPKANVIRYFLQFAVLTTVAVVTVIGLGIFWSL